jgi:adenine-specific DNA-methyltransferase
MADEERIREYIYYVETKQKLVRKRKAEHFYLLDTYQDTGYYFYYEKEKITTLSLETLNIVTEKAEQYIIYADNCLLDKDYMVAKNIIFKKIPRDIKRF